MNHTFLHQLDRIFLRRERRPPQPHQILHSDSGRPPHLHLHTHPTLPPRTPPRRRPAHRRRVDPLPPHPPPPPIPAPAFLQKLQPLFDLFPSRLRSAEPPRAPREPARDGCTPSLQTPP